MRSCSQCAAPVEEEGKFCGQCGAPLDPRRDPDDGAWLGRVVDRRYRVLSRLGTGGMGIVYRVEHLHLGKIAAMKVLHADMARDQRMVKRFRTEAQAVSRLNHPNIVQTFDFGQSEDALYLVMEYVRGDDLAAVLAREGPMPFARAGRLFAQICSALGDAHEAGVIHRDLKPENLMRIQRRDGSEHAKVLDFGLAKLREREDGAVGLSGSHVIGTPYYMSPEQVRSEPLDARTDLYSLGATLYRVLTGHPPFEGGSPVELLARHLTDEVVPPSRRAPELDIPASADRIVLRAMARSRESRYASAAEIQAELESAVGRAGSSGHSAEVGGAWAESVPPRSEARTVELDDSEVGSGGERLRRRDVDAFERALRRRKVLTRLVAPVVGLGALAAVVAFLARGPKVPQRTAEIEPNNTPGYATTIAPDLPLRGWVGKALEGGQPDQDYYLIPAEGRARVATARVDGIPGVDLVVELFDNRGERLAKADARGPGAGEWLAPTPIGPGEAFVCVRQVWVAGAKPTEDIREPYTLTVGWEPPQAGWEREPNGSESAANALALGEVVRGHLPDLEDVDWYVVTAAEAGPIAFRVEVPAGVDVVILTGGKKPHDKAGPGQAEEVTTKGDASSSLVVGVARAPVRGDPKTYGIAGIDQPYQVTATLQN